MACLASSLSETIEILNCNERAIARVVIPAEMQVTGVFRERGKTAEQRPQHPNPPAAKTSHD